MAADRYRLIEVIGAGGMATVWKAEDTELDREVAVKVISDTLSHDTDFMRRFAREARIAASLSHPNLVRVFDYDPDAERPYLVMELIEGRTLADAQASGEPIDVELLAQQLLAALAHIHEAGVVHRDIKPANVLISGDGSFLLTDFGIAQSADATRYTQTGNVIGTLRYMAPELHRGEAATPRSDLYSAGVLLAECSGDQLSPALALLVSGLTSAEPEGRPASAAVAAGLIGVEATAVTAEQPHRDAGAAAAAGALGGAAVDATAATEPISATGPIATGRRRRVAPAALAVLILAAIAGIALALLAGGGDSATDSSSTTSSPKKRTTTVTTQETTTVPAPAPPPTNPAGKVPPGQVADDCTALEEQKQALEEQWKADEKTFGSDKEAKDAAKADYEARKHALDEQIKACNEAQKP